MTGAGAPITGAGRGMRRSGMGVTGSPGQQHPLLFHRHQLPLLLHLLLLVLLLLTPLHGHLQLPHA
jgi:hypothetical protein